MQRTITPVSIRTMEMMRDGMIIQYPHIGHVDYPHARRSMNDAIIDLVQSMITEQQEKQETHQFAEMIGEYEIKTNERNVLSITLSNYAIAPGAANGLTIVRSLTFDVPTGQRVRLSDLFLPRSAYVQRLSMIVQQQLMDRDIPTLHHFSHISPEQDFYIADKALVLYFQAIEITPHYVGVPMFPISVYDIEDIINPDGPLGRMLPA